MIKFWDEKTKKIVNEPSVTVDAPVEEPKSTRSRSRK